MTFRWFGWLRKKPAKIETVKTAFAKNNEHWVFGFASERFSSMRHISTHETSEPDDGIAVAVAVIAGAEILAACTSGSSDSNWTGDGGTFDGGGASGDW